VKRNLRKLDNSSYWWKHEKSTTDWAVEKDGYWYIISGSEFPEKKISKKDRRMKLRNKRRSERSNKFNPWWALVVVSALLGVSLALNFVYYILSKQP